MRVDDDRWHNLEKTRLEWDALDTIWTPFGAILGSRMRPGSTPRASWGRDRGRVGTMGAALGAQSLKLTTVAHFSMAPGRFEDERVERKLLRPSAREGKFGPAAPRSSRADKEQGLTTGNQVLVLVLRLRN